MESRRQLLDLGRGGEEALFWPGAHRQGLEGILTYMNDRICIRQKEQTTGQAPQGGAAKDADKGQQTQREQGGKEQTPAQREEDRGTAETPHMRAALNHIRNSPPIV
jgi:hypothetical protein